MTLFGLALGLVMLSLVSIGEASAQPPSRFPNIVLLLVDDLGWRDVGPYGQEHIDTPVINQLAKDGMRYTQAYANAPVCSPQSRFYSHWEKPCTPKILWSHHRDWPPSSS